MKEYRVESFAYYSKLTTNKRHICESSQEEIQATMDNYAEEGYRLVSTDAASFGAAMYVYIYFEKIS